MSFAKYSPMKIFIILAVLCFLSLMATSGMAGDNLVESLRAHPASLRSKDLSVPVLLRSIGRQAGVNIFVADNITGVISLDMEDVTLHEIFQLVIRTRGLHYSEGNQAIIVETLADYLESGRGITTERVCMDFSNGSDVKGQLETLLSERGSITVTSDNSCLLIKDRAENIAVIEEMLSQIDKPNPQIHIESRIVFISKEGRDRLGVKWGMDGSNNNVLGANSGTFTNLTDLGVQAASTNMAMGLIWDNFSLDVDLQALLDENLLQILSAPSLLVLDGQTAMIKNGKEVPYTSQSGDSVSNTEFREALLSLEVTPKISKDAYLRLDVAVTNDSVDQTNDVDGEPLINRQEIKTMLFLKDRVTVVIGGIHVSSDDLDISKVHGLGDIPFLGALFRSKAKTTGNYELMIFLTPTIVSMETLLGTSERHLEKVDRALGPDIHKKFKPEVYQQQESSAADIVESSNPSLEEEN